MHKFTFIPEDILFCKDGRPMTGTTGYGATLPAPHIISSSILSALHRNDIDDDAVALLEHRHHKGGFGSQTKAKASKEKSQKFGSLKTVGPFPEYKGQVCYPTPRDLLSPGTKTALKPMTQNLGKNNLPKNLKPLVSQIPPSKEKVPEWLCQDGWAQYLSGTSVSKEHFINSNDLFAKEAHTGIGIDEKTGTTLKGQIYSATRLRLSPDCRLTALAELKDNRGLEALEQLIPEDHKIMIGGESRVCRMQRRKIREDGYLPKQTEVSGCSIKWVLLSPCLFPRIDLHTGGWLPNWISQEDYSVQILDGPGANKARRLRVSPGKPIRAKLVSALVGKPQVITGWSTLQNDEKRGGAKSTLLAVPAGSIYYFEAEDEEQAKKLAQALSFPNRRSTLMGEKGYGIGICTNY